MRRAWCRRSAPGLAVAIAAVTGAAAAVAFAAAASRVAEPEAAPTTTVMACEQVFVSRPVVRSVSETTYVQQTRTETVPVQRTVEVSESRTEMVPVTVNVQVSEQQPRTKQVPVTVNEPKQVIEKVPVTTTVLVPEERTEMVPTVQSKEVTEDVTPASRGHGSRANSRDHDRHAAKAGDVNVIQQVPVDVPVQVATTIMITQRRAVTEYVNKQVAVSVPEQVPVTVMTTQQRQVPRQVAVTRLRHGPGDPSGGRCTGDELRARGLAPEVGSRSS